MKAYSARLNQSGAVNTPCLRDTNQYHERVCKGNPYILTKLAHRLAVLDDKAQLREPFCKSQCRGPDSAANVYDKRTICELREWKGYPSMLVA